MNLSLSPLDDRYKKYTENINNYFSEYAFFYYRILIFDKFLHMFVLKIIDERLIFFQPLTMKLQLQKILKI